MKRIGLVVIALAATGLVVTPTAIAGEQWLHVHVDSGSDNERVNINLPLAVVERMLPLITVDELDHGKLDLDLGEIDGIDLPELAAALRDAPDAEYVTVRSDDESVRIAKEGGMILVDVDEHGRKGESVRIRMPLAVFEAMVGSNTDEIDLLAAIRALGGFHGQDLVRVESDDASVRVWIDSSATGI